MVVQPASPQFAVVPKGLPIVGNLPQVQRQGILNYYINLWRTHGDLVQFSMGPLKAFLFVRPEHIQHIFVKNPDKYIKGLSHDRLRTAIGNGILTLEGAPWRSQRRLMQPTYTPKSVRQFSDIMVEASQSIVARWQKLAQTGQPIDLNDEMTQVTIRVIFKSVFGIDMTDDFRHIASALHNLLQYTANSAIAVIDMPLFIPTPRNQQFKAAKQLVREFIFKLIRQRREEGLKDDLLSMLMTAIDEDTGKPMTDEQLHDEILVTFFAGHETTASLLTWTWYLLSHNPEVETKLFAELDAQLNGRVPTLEDTKHLLYARMVLDETLRLYSPIPLIARDVAVADVIEGQEIPVNSMVTVLPYATHRHPDYWEKPEEFYPEHFLPEAVEKRPRYAYMPFGAGHRICIGNHFALLESILFVADIAQRFRLRPADDFDGSTIYFGVLRPKRPVMMRLEPR